MLYLLKYQLQAFLHVLGINCPNLGVKNLPLSLKSRFDWTWFVWRLNSDINLGSSEVYTSPGQSLSLMVTPPLIVTTLPVQSTFLYLFGDRNRTKVRTIIVCHEELWLRSMVKVPKWLTNVVWAVIRDGGWPVIASKFLSNRMSQYIKIIYKISTII